MIDHSKDRCRQGVDNGLGKNPLRRVFFRPQKSAGIVVAGERVARALAPSPQWVEVPAYEAINCRNT